MSFPPLAPGSMLTPSFHSPIHFKGFHDFHLYEMRIGEKIRRGFEKHFKSPFAIKIDLPSLFLLRSRLFLLAHLQF